MDWEDINYGYLRKLSISELSLIILNNKNNDNLRKCAEFELKLRIKNLGIKYDDFLQMEYEVIDKRGKDIDNYLLSPNVNMQQLMDVFFEYDYPEDMCSPYLLFSEKHLCNISGLGEPFFKNLCLWELANIDRQLEVFDDDLRDNLLLVREILLERQKLTNFYLRDARTGAVIIEEANEAICHITWPEGIYDSSCPIELLFNANEEELYKMYRTWLGRIKGNTLVRLNNSNFLNSDMIQFLLALRFSRKDSAKLKKQKRLLLDQAKCGYKVNYQSEHIQKGLSELTDKYTY